MQTAPTGNRRDQNSTANLSYCFVFVCQKGPLEAKSALIAASLRKWLRCEGEIVAAIPKLEDQLGTPSSATTTFLESLDVRFVSIENDVDPKYLIGNKIACLGTPTNCDRTIFLDTDILCMREFHNDARLAGDFAAKPADTLTYGQDRRVWEQVYAATKVAMPTETTRTTVSLEESPPYFNAGMIQVKDGPAFSRMWSACCRTIDSTRDIGPKRPWLDQIGLPTAVAKLSLSPQVLEEEFNFPAHLRTLSNEEPPPLFCHYHTPSCLLSTSLGRSHVHDLVQEYSGLGEILDRDQAWQDALHPPNSKRWIPKLISDYGRHARYTQRQLSEVWHKRRTSEDIRSRNILVTGFPRSGTSLFSALLNSIDDVVCLNEVSPTPQIFRFFRNQRKRILDQKPIKNTYGANGQLSTNTIERNTEVIEKVASVQTDRFVLAQKWTLPYLNSLPKLISSGFRIWVIVRHPRYSIASWKRCPAHFAIARVTPADWQLKHIPFSTPEADIRRIEIWNHYAKLIHKHRDNINIVRYEDLIANPLDHINSFCHEFGLQPPAELPPIDSRNHDDAYETISSSLGDAINEKSLLDLFGYEPI